MLRSRWLDGKTVVTVYLYLMLWDLPVLSSHPLLEFGCPSQNIPPLPPCPNKVKLWLGEAAVRSSASEHRSGWSR